MNRSGYLIVLQPHLDLKNYEALHYIKQNLHQLKNLRELLNFIDPSKYRGTGRQQFDTAPFFAHNGQLEVWENINLSVFKSVEARKMLALPEDANTTDDIEEPCLYSFEEMQEVYQLIEDKKNYEIIHFIERFAETNEESLGFDVGYLATNYSVIADTAIKPTWHPPDFDDMQDIIEHLRQLNEHCLFPTLEQAEAYRDVYLTKDWGEKELFDRQITTVQVRNTIRPQCSHLLRPYIYD